MDIPDKIIKMVSPSAREIWRIPDKEVYLHDKGKPGKPRYALVIFSGHQDIDLSIINIIPLTTQSDFYDCFVFPIERGLINIEDNFKPKQNSTALIQFFQPIKMDYFVEKCAEVDDTTHEAIKTIICERLIGCSNINLEI